MAEDIAGVEWRIEELRTSLIAPHEKGLASVLKTGTRHGFPGF